MVSNYLGTDTFISLKEPPEEEGQERVRSLNVRALVTNRHLTDKLPVGQGKRDFVSVSDTKLDLECIAGPTPPRESLLVGGMRGRGGESDGFGSCGNWSACCSSTILGSPAGPQAIRLRRCGKY